MTDTAVAGTDARLGRWPAAVIIFLIMGVITAAAWTWYDLPVAVALGVGFIEIAPIRRQNGVPIALAASAAAAGVIMLSGFVNSTVLGYTLFVSVCTFVAGYSARWGLYNAAVLLPLVLVILSSAPTPEVALPRAVALLLGAVLGTVLLGILRLDPPTGDRVLPADAAAWIGATLAVIVGLTLYLTATFEVVQGHWITASILSIVVPSLEDTKDRSWRRTGATIGGAVLAGAVALSVTSGEVVVALALAAAVASAVLTNDYEWRITWLTVSVVLYAGGGQGSESAALARAIATAIGAGLVLFSTWALTALDRLATSRFPPPAPPDG